MTTSDWTIIAIYLLAVVSLGVATGFIYRKGKPGGESGHYFLLGWPLIGLAMSATTPMTGRKSVRPLPRRAFEILASMSPRSRGSVFS